MAKKGSKICGKTYKIEQFVPKAKIAAHFWYKMMVDTSEKFGFFLIMASVNFNKF